MDSQFLCIFETLIRVCIFTVQTVELRMQGKKLHIPGLTEMFVESEADIEEIMDTGNQNRHVASTKMNSTRYCTGSILNRTL